MIIYRSVIEMAIDSHTHVNKLVLTNPKEEINKINNDSNLSRVINVGIDYHTSHEANNIAEDNAKFYSAVGYHPLHLDQISYSNLVSEAIREKVVAIGEIGLDTGNKDYKAQRNALIGQIMIANQLHLPVIIHANNTNKEIIEIIKKVKPLYGCVFHCFQPDFEALEYLIGEGYYISIGSKITYHNARLSLEIAKCIPENLFLVETDAPYMSPEPFRNQQGSSTMLNRVIDVIARERQTTSEEIDRITTENTLRLFKKMK